jgi:hypothetical protein
VSYQETIRPALDLNLIQEVNARPGFAFVVVGGGAPRPLFFPHHVPQSVALQRAASAITGLQVASAQNKSTPSVPVGKPAPPAASAPTVVALSTRLTTLGSRVRSSIFVSKLRGKP